jgi:hypothetical protein
MILHENTLISEDVFEKHFICDLNKCRGACCIEGDFGAPLAQNEVEILKSEYTHIEPYLTEASRKHIAKKGIWEHDKDGDIVTTCLPTGECNFSYRDDKGILGCAIEKAYNEGKTSFQKPVSCHLYPIRMSKVGDYDALNYHRWDICKPACKLGDKHKVSVFEFLKGPLVRVFGEAWYNEVQAIWKEYSKK